MGIVPCRFKKVTLPGFSNYLGSNLNGINSSSYGQYGGSYILVTITSIINQTSLNENISK